MSRVHYTRFQLLRFLVGDLKHDAKESAGTEYGDRCRRQIGVVFQQRHTTRLDAYGWPECLKADASTGAA